jgi:5-oxoprolinase (ATP-hydrolysing)
MQQRELIIEAVSVEAIGGGAMAAERASATASRSAPLAAKATARMYSEGHWRDTPLYARDEMRPGDVIGGPAIIAEANATTVVEPDWEAIVTDFNHMVLERTRPRAAQQAIGTDADPIMLEVFNNLFMSIAEQMGLRLQNTAYSVNIKERLDFSCALFDATGNLIANAPHMPVHLGSMSESIKTVMRENAGTMKSGDAYAINDPYHGGTHLPDVTVITPVFDRAGAEILFYVGSRGHHADIGGITPGSMPPFSTSLDEEGTRFINFKLVEGQGGGQGNERPGRLREGELMTLLTSGAYPARNPEQNVADLRAQIAANEKGREELLRMVQQFGLDVVRAYMQHVQDNAEESVRRVITRLKDGQFDYTLDNGALIRVRIRVDRKDRSATIDFTGSSNQLPNNFNAPSAVCYAAVLYVFRTLVDSDIPLNAGCLKPLHVVIPERSMLNPRYPAAVVAGNVETSSCITDALYGALGVMAAAQGTMNNFTFGNERYQYYETISGGSGAGIYNIGASEEALEGSHEDGFNGTDVVQTHMTNSRLTDPEVLEFRYPVRLESYEIRANSGGAGRWHGGNGGTRRVRFLEPMTASILANHRSIAPFGMAGGEPGEVGRNWIERIDGRVETMGHIGSAEMNVDDVIVIQTPGGGGFGKK